MHGPLSDLILVPTELEASVLRPGLEKLLGRSDIALELCGFGPVAAAARSMQLLHLYQPQHVWLIGIAGRLSSELRIGHAYWFDEVVCYGVGIGAGVGFRSAQQIGWKQWSGDPPIDDRLQLTFPDSGTEHGGTEHGGGQLLTACAAMAEQSELPDRMAVYPKAAAEDMEGFAVAASCGLHGTPLSIVRGISNDCGDRNHEQWSISQALKHAAELCKQALAARVNH